jgi:uracil-DNA glycosylase
MHRISIEPSFAAWRRAARDLLQRGVEPAGVEWVEGGDDAAGLSGVEAGASSGTGSLGTASLVAAAPTAAAIPRDLLEWLKTAACFHAPDRWALLYRVLWRWAHGERHAANPDDPDGAVLAQRVQAVEQETRALIAGTLFRRRDPSMGPPEFVGWSEPQHDVLERVADIFATRMGESTWMLATPRDAMFWNGMLLHVPRTSGEAAAPSSSANAMTGEAITSESTEALWLAYFGSASSGGIAPETVALRYWRMPPAGPPLPAHLAHERNRRGAPSGTVTVEPRRTIEYVAETPPLREPAGPLATCRRCALWRNAKQAVAGAGAASAKIMAIGEQPGEYENQHGQPFTGEAGQLLDKVLERAGLDRERLYLTYAVKHYKWEARELHHERQRVHRPPEPREIEACQFWLERELSQVDPRVIVTLGATALKALTGPHINLSEYLGKTIAHGGRLIVPTWHPAYALRTADAGLREDIVGTIAAAFRRAVTLVEERVESHALSGSAR